MRFAPQAWPYVGALSVLAVFSFFWLPLWAAAFFVALALAVLGFFRDPVRQFTGSDAAIVSPADGLVTLIDEIVDEQVDTQPRPRVVIFLNVFNVHVQRSPCAGEVVSSERRRGKKLAAFKEDVDRINESHLTVLRRPDGSTLGVRQIAGLVARRVVPYLQVGDRVARGERLGVIQFGSRVDVLLPPGYRAAVAVGQKVRTTSSLLAEPDERSTS